MTHMPPKKKDLSSGVKTKVQAFRPTAEQKFQQCQRLWQTEVKKKSEKKLEGRRWEKRNLDTLK